jgi:hypothetical protein
MMKKIDECEEKRLLFVLKARSTYGVSYGLVNSCKFICNALEKRGVRCKVVEVKDNNCIDKEVFRFQPTHVFIDALWVVPDKFRVLLQKYPNVRWGVRIHSKIPFLANEGIAIQWLYGYQSVQEDFNNFTVGSNAHITADQLTDIGIDSRYFPNIYDPIPEHHEDFDLDKNNPTVIDVGCFGAIRPLKNHLQQATAAIIFADKIGRKMRFHINSNRVEQHGEPILKNLEHLFRNSRHELIKHDWMSHGKFLKLVNKMELGLQVSFSESYNIVAADFVEKNIPLIGSPDIEWLSGPYQADPNDYKDIADKLKNAWNYRRIGLHWINRFNLRKNNKEAVELWLNYLYE